MSRCVSILLVGIGGYGNFYVDALLNPESIGEEFTIAGFVDIQPEKSPRITEIRERGIPIYRSIEEFYKSNTADLAIIATPIHFHCKQTCYALIHGSNVLCEKPAAATVQEVKTMMDIRDKTGKFVAIGYQWSHSDAIFKLKNDVMSGVLGRPKRCKTIVLWPRNDKYFSRSWAGRKYDDQGNPILDSIAHNATAHYLHNMFYVLGDRIDSSLYPDYVEAELYRANSIQNFDTVAMRAFAGNGVEFFYTATHAVNEVTGPDFYFEFENACVIYKEPKANDQGEEKGLDEERNIKAVFKDGTVKFYGNPHHHSYDKIRIAIRAARDGSPIPCGLEAAAAQVLCVNGMQDSMRDIVDFPKNLLHHDESMWLGEKGIWVEGLGETLKECWEKWMLPSEMGVPWAKAGKRIDLKSYSGYSE